MEENAHSIDLYSRNRNIYAEHAEGKTVKLIAATHGISRSRVWQILGAGDYRGKSLALLPGTEELSPVTRGLLIRMGYKSADSVLRDLENGKLRFGCHCIGQRRFDEITAWAREQRCNGTRKRKAE
jgi:hypothetical protein